MVGLWGNLDLVSRARGCVTSEVQGIRRKDWGLKLWGLGFRV